LPRKIFAVNYFFTTHNAARQLKSFRFQRRVKILQIFTTSKIYFASAIEVLYFISLKFSEEITDSGRNEPRRSII